jgi:nucleoside-diphosphate-sugar epimerase
MRILFTGADGYIGAVLGPKLLERGHHAVGLDTGLYRRGWLFDDHRTRPMVVTKDIRKVAVEDLRGYDAFVHLAELSNDPLAENDPELTLMINHRGSVALAELAREAGVKRFIYASSCSIYGAGGTDLRTETAAANPQSAYARCKVLVERDVGAMKGDGFEPVFLRNATAFGASPRQRFDLVLNNLAGWAWTHNEIRMTSDGSPWRPLVHIEDICEAVLCALDAPGEAVSGEAFNVGADQQNYAVRDIAEIVAATFPGCGLSLGVDNGDTRSYRVSFAKIREHMPSFRCRWDAERGAKQMRTVFEQIDLTKEMFFASPFTRLSELKYLQRTRQVDAELYWAKPAGSDQLAQDQPGRRQLAAAVD